MSYKILVVDDEVDIRSLLAQFLKTEGYDIEVAVDGLDALEKINASRPDLVISDIRMPRCNGFDLLDNVSKLGSSPLPMLFISGYVGMNTNAVSENKNFAGFISKPVKWNILVSSIQKIQSEFHKKSVSTT